MLLDCGLICEGLGLDFSTTVHVHVLQCLSPLLYQRPTVANYN